MTDVFDRAQEREEEMRSDALDEQRRHAQPAATESADVCTRCDMPIPMARRLAIPGVQTCVQTCVQCQSDLERIHRWKKGAVK